MPPCPPRYRGEVRVAADTHYVIYFIDWGNCEHVPPAAVAPLPAGLEQVPPQAVLAALPWRPAGAGGDWSGAQWEGLRALDGVALTASVVGTEPTVSVALFNLDGKSVLSVMGGGARTAADGEEEWIVPPLAEASACGRL